MSEVRQIDVEGEARGYPLLADERDPVQAFGANLRMAARHRLATKLCVSLGHDLRSPLNTIAINMDLLRSLLTKNPPADALVNERQQRYLKVLEEELARVNRSLQALMDPISPPEETPRPFDLRELIRDAISLIAPLARRHQVAVESQTGEQTITLEGHRDPLKQALLHLILNALEAIPAGGKVIVKLEIRQDQALITVQDHGPGIPAEVADRIWNVHFSTKTTEPGTGLGLPVARSCVEGYGGTLTLKAEATPGACFVVSIPISPEGVH